MIGKSFYDKTVQPDMKHWPFTVVSDNGKPVIEVEYKRETKQFFSEEISSMVLSKMKEIAESYLGKTVTKAVVTVPTTFNYFQKQAIINAGTMSGLNVIRIINDTTAAAIAYGYERNGIVERNVLMFGLGGGYLDVSVLTIYEDGIFEVKSNAGNTHLGGEDFVNRIVNHFVEKFKVKYNKDLSINKNALRRLRTACERAKRTLSITTQTSIEIDMIFEGIDFYSTITRYQFELLNYDLFLSTLEPIYKALSDAKMEKSQIDDIVLVGGSTRIPKIQKLLQEFFNGKELNKKSINPEEGVAYGAAVYAAIINRDHLFGEFNVKGIPSNSRDFYQIEVNFDIEANNIESVSEVDKRSGGEFMTFYNERFNKGYCVESIDEFERMIRRVDNLELKLIEEQQFRLQAMKYLHLYALNIWSAVEDENNKHIISEVERNILLDKFQDVIQWLYYNPSADKNMSAHKHKQIECICNPIINKLYQSAGGLPQGFIF